MWHKNGLFCLSFGLEAQTREQSFSFTLEINSCLLRPVLDRTLSCDVTLSVVLFVWLVGSVPLKVICADHFLKHMGQPHIHVLSSAGNGDKGPRDRRLWLQRVRRLLGKRSLRQHDQT